MGETEAEKDKVTRHELCHDRHTVSLLTDHLVFSPKYRGKVLDGEVAEAAEEINRETCKELDIEIIDMAVNMDHVHLFIKIDKKKEKTLKTGYTALYAKFFMEGESGSQK